MMGKGCVTATKYFLFLFNLLFLLFGIVIMGFGLWLLLDHQSFVVVLSESRLLQVTCYILISVGAFSILLGFLGCLGAVYEVRCLLGLYFSCVLLIFITQITAGLFIYFQQNQLHQETSKIITKVLDQYPGNNGTTEQAWDFIQRTMQCCGWNDGLDWMGNLVIQNSSQLLFPCSCENVSLSAGNSSAGFCESPTAYWPVYQQGCSSSILNWIVTNVWVVLGVCVSVALLQLLAVILSVCLWKNVGTEDYTKVPKY